MSDDGRATTGERGVTDFRLPPSLLASLIFVRHGESTWIAEGRFQGRQDPPLSALGARQAELVAARLLNRTAGSPLPIPLGAPIGIWHSPLRRAADTARAIAAAQPDGLALHATDELTELAQGEWEGVPAAEVRARWPAELARWREAPTLAHAPGGEPILEAAARVRRGLGRVIAELAAGGGTTVAAGDEATTGAPPRLDAVPGYPSPEPAEAAPPEPWAVLVAHDGIFRLALLTLLGVPYERFWSFPFNLCAITAVALSQGVPTLRAHNLSEHLALLAEEERAAAEARGDRRGAL